MPKINPKGQITIPKEIRDEWGLNAGDEVSFRRTKRGTVEMIRKTPSNPFLKYQGFLKHLRGKDPDEILNELRGPAE
jgi:AbrB family looped-hinge helix DNA binding protein